MAPFSGFISLGDRLIAFGCSRKTAAEQRIGFGNRFSASPIVLVTPHWENSSRNVGHAETIDTVADDHFYLASGNAASDGYFVHWMAFGNRDGAGTNPFRLNEGALTAQFGRASKPSTTPSFEPFLEPFSSTPRMQLSPHWNRARSGVGQEETTIGSSTASFTLSSGNAASNYSVNWLAVVSEERGRETFPLGDGYLMQTGVAGKNAAETRVRYPVPFRDSVAVIVTPRWRAPVGHAETLKSVDRDGFDLISGNAASDYAVNWVALGRSV